MSASSGLLRCREVRGLTINSEIIVCAGRDGFFVFADEFGDVHTFDSLTLCHTVLPPKDKRITGSVAAIDFSPSRRFAAVSFIDGSIQVFDLEQNKPGKVVAKPRATFASSLLFLDDTMFLAGDGHNLVAYKFMQALGFLATIREMLVGQFQSEILKLSAPPVYRYVTGANGGSKCLAEGFAQKFAVCTQRGVNYAKITPDFKINTIFQFDYAKATAVFSLVNTDLCLLAIGKRNMMKVVSIDGQQKGEEIWSSEIDFDPAHIAFLNDTMLIALDEGLNGAIVSVTDKTLVKISRPCGFGFFVGGIHEFFVIQSPNIWMLTLQTFQDKMEELCEQDDIEAAVSFAKKALHGTSSATIGLPVNSAQRALVIERCLSDLLVQGVEKQFSQENANPTAIAASLVSLNMDLNMQDWMINDAVEIFEGHKCVQALMQEIIAQDPKGQFFNYTVQFVERLLKARPDFDVTGFVMSLSRRVAPPALLLRYGLDIDNPDFIADVFIMKAKDVVCGLSVLANAGKFTRVCEIIANERNVLGDCIKWLLSKEGEKFPLVTQVMKAVDCTLMLDMFKHIEDHLIVNTTPFTITDYASAMICAITDAGLALGHPMQKRIEELILTRKMKVTGPALVTLLERIFTQEVAEPDHREELLLQIFASGVPLAFEEKLLPLCDIYQFQEAKFKIRHDTKNYEDAVKEMLADPDSDVIGMMRSLAERDPEAIPSIEKGILSNATVLALRDADSLAEFCATFIGPRVIHVINEIKQDTIQCHFIHRVIQRPVYASIELPDDVSINFCTFMCKHYPSEVRNFLVHRENLMRQLLPACEKYDVFDGCAIIYNYLTDLEKVRSYLIRFIESQLVLYVQGKIEIDMNSTTEFITTFVESYLRTRATQDDTHKFAVDMVEAYVLPLYAVEMTQCGSEKSGELCRSLRKLCLAVANVIPFPELLELLVVNYQEFRFGTLKSVILAVMDDYNYDVDQNLTMSLLYHEDEAHAHSSYVEGLVHGLMYKSLCCATCHHRLCGVASSIQLFSCGHAFHHNSICLPKEVCPICHTVEKLNDNIPLPIRPLESAAYRQQLAHFEQSLAPEATSRALDEERCAAITMMPIVTFPL